MRAASSLFNVHRQAILPRFSIELTVIGGTSHCSRVALFVFTYPFHPLEWRSIPVLHMFSCYLQWNQAIRRNRELETVVMVICRGQNSLCAPCLLLQFVYQATQQASPASPANTQSTQCTELCVGTWVHNV